MKIKTSIKKVVGFLGSPNTVQGAIKDLNAVKGATVRAKDALKEARPLAKKTLKRAKVAYRVFKESDGTEDIRLED